MATAAAMVSSGSLPLPTNAPMPSTMAAYTAVTPADSRVNSSARLMMTSMSNSRRRRIAIAMATGMPKYTRNGVMAYGTVCSGLFCLAGRDGQDADDLADQHPGDDQGQPLHLLAQPLVAAAVPERQRYHRRRQQQQEQHGQAVQGAEPGGRLEGRDRQRVGIGQRDAARRGQRHLPRADHERGQRQAGQPQAGQRGRAPAGRGQPPGREDQEDRGQAGGHEHEDGTRPAPRPRPPPGAFRGAPSCRRSRRPSRSIMTAVAAPSASMNQPTRLPARRTISAPSAA